MINVTNNFITQISLPGKIKDAYIKYENKEPIRTTSMKISFTGNLFKTIMKQIDLEIKNNENIIDKEINAKYGLNVNGTFEYINYGTFIVTECETVIKENKIKATCYDNMIKFMVKYNFDNLNCTFPCKIIEFVQAMCSFLGVGIYSTEFYNKELIIDSDLFTALDCTYRDILDYICQVTCTTAIIKDDKLYFKKIEDTEITVGIDILKTLNLREKFGPCNSLVLGRGSINDNVYSKNDAMITAYGLQEIKFDNNEIIDDRRELVIDGMFQQIKGIEYYSFEATDLGLGFIEPADLITVKDPEDNEYKVLVLNMSITITSGVAGTMSADVPNTSTTNYSYATDSEKKQNRTEWKVNKQDQTIAGTVENVEAQNQKLSLFEQTLNSLKSAITEVADVTISTDGYGSINLDNVNESEPIRIEIRPRGEDIAYLYPRNNLYASNTLFLKNRKIRFATEGYAIDYELPTDLLYYDSENYDEFILDYEGQSCIVNKKVAYNADGTKYLLENPTTLSFPYPNIPLQTGNYTVTVLGYPSAYLFVRLMTQNIYTTQFTTKAEMQAAINILSNMITLELTKKLDNEEFTGASIILQMNNDTSEIKIKADKLGLEGYTTINQNFKIDEQGNMSCKDATISGTISNGDDPETGISKMGSRIYNDGRIKGTSLDIYSESIGNFENVEDLIDKLLEGGKGIVVYPRGTSLSGDTIALICNDGIIFKNKENNTNLIKLTTVFNEKGQLVMPEGTINLDNGIIYTKDITASGYGYFETYVKTDGQMYAENFVNNSEEKLKTNIKKLSTKKKKVLDVIKNTDICEFNYKKQKEKTIGLVIGDKYNYPKEIIKTQTDKQGNVIKGVDLYSMCSLAWQALKEAQDENAKLQERIEKLEKIIEGKK